MDSTRSMARHFSCNGGNRMAKIILRSLTPFHLGTGNTYSYLECYVMEKTLYRINQIATARKFRNSPDASLFRKYMDALGNRSISDINRNQRAVFYYLKKGVALYHMPFYGQRVHLSGNYAIRECLKQRTRDQEPPLKPYIPGSTVKGFLRTAILWDCIKNKPEFTVEVHGKKITMNLEDVLINGYKRRSGQSRQYVVKGLKQLKTAPPEKRQYIYHYLAQEMERLVFFTGSISGFSSFNKMKNNRLFDLLKFLLVSDFSPRNDFDLHVDNVITFSTRRGGRAVAIDDRNLLEACAGTFVGEIQLSPQVATVLNNKNYHNLECKLPLIGIDDDVDIFNDAWETIENAMFNHLQEIATNFMREAIRSEKRYLHVTCPHPELVTAREKEFGAGKIGFMRLGYGIGARYRSLLLNLLERNCEEYWHVIEDITPHIRHSCYKHPRASHSIIIPPFPRTYKLLQHRKQPLGWFSWETEIQENITL
ncbi:type III-A CRISPR-associated RAMP protein Csm5 [Candidatus Bathyarchaeota archaeon]|nr:type III-A CRISPR-associated RAMP protein Csm5 [Candidatus Bathyarchaeota archaeon]